MSAPYPWLAEHWASLLGRQAEGRLGHAYLLCGREGLGKFELAEAFVQRLLCENADAGGDACGSCRGCLLLRSGNHPDFKLLVPEEERKTVVIDQVRDLIDFFTLKSHYLGYKIGIVHPADSMNTAAANALLKLLEEPPDHALLMLVAHRPGLLPATVASRCQRLNVAMPSWAEREAWLLARAPREPAPPAIDDLALHGAPLEIARQLSSSTPGLLNELITALGAAFKRDHAPLEAVRRLAEHDVRHFIDALEALLQALIQLRVGHAPSHLRLPAAARAELQEIANKLNCQRLFLMLDQVALARSTVLRSSGVRGSEVIESLWFGWVRTAQTETMG